MHNDDFNFSDPTRAEGTQTSVIAASNFYEGPFDHEENLIEMRAKDGLGNELYMKMGSPNIRKDVNGGIDSYWAVRKLTEVEKDQSWIEDSDYDSAEEVVSPSYEDMDELSSNYSEQLENASTDTEKRHALEEIWEEAAEMDLEGTESFR